MNEKIIWDFIYGKCHNAYGTAALMGNLMAESSLNPACATGKNKTVNYVEDADSGKIDFAHDSVAFGLVQWCYWSRKQALFEYAKNRNKSVGNIAIQLEYMWKELSESYKTAYNAVISSTNIRESSDIIMLKYEKPANTSEPARKKRADYGQKFFNMFAESVDEQGEKIPKTSSKKVIITKDRVNLRAGNGKNFPIISRVNKNAMYEWVATSEDGWHAIKIPGKVVWVSGEFSKV